MKSFSISEKRRDSRDKGRREERRSGGGENMHVDCKLTLEPISVGAIDTG